MTRKQELAEKVNLQFDEVIGIFSLETLESMYMSQIVGGNNTVAQCGCGGISNTAAQCGCTTNSTAQCGCSGGAGSGNASGNTIKVNNAFANCGS